MLIIFDLDDTLIDTSGSVTPFKMKACLEKLVQEGLSVDCFDKAYAELLALNASALRSKDALIEFVVKNGGASFLADQVMGEMISPLPANFPVRLTPNAKEILDTFVKKHTLALVTGGHPPFQLEKLEKAGIDRAYFSKIAIPEDSIKKPLYREILTEFGCRPEEVLVCGDRVAMDLKPAFELGITTVHMRWGRGIIGKTEPWVDHAISDLSELRRIVEV